MNSNIDRQGLSREDFDEDPDFREEYFNGAYDVPCVGCKGKRVQPEPAYDVLSTAQRTYVRQYIEDFFDEQRDQWREREYGY